MWFRGTGARGAATRQWWRFYGTLVRCGGAFYRRCAAHGAFFSAALILCFLAYCKILASKPDVFGLLDASSHAFRRIEPALDGFQDKSKR